LNNYYGYEFFKVDKQKVVQVFLVYLWMRLFSVWSDDFK